MRARRQQQHPKLLRQVILTAQPTRCKLALMMTLMCGAAAMFFVPVHAQAQDTSSYTPPPLFGAPTPAEPEADAKAEGIAHLPPPLAASPPVKSTRTIKRTPLVLPPPEARIPAPIENENSATEPLRGVAVEPKSAPIFDTRGNAALEEAASVAERVENPVQTVAPISTEVLLDHKADRVAENAQDALKKAEAQQHAAPSSIPDLSPYDNAADGEKSSPPKSEKKKTTTITRSQKPKVTTTTIEMKSRVYGADDYPAKLGKGQTAPAPRGVTSSSSSPLTTDVIPRKAPALPPPAPRKMPAMPPAHVQSSALPDLPSSAMTAPPLPTDDIPALDENLLSSQLLSTADTSVGKSPETAAPPLPDIAQISVQDGVLGDQHVLLVFSASQTDLSEELRGRLDENVTPRLEKDAALRVEIRAYAGPDGNAQSADRRISLARGLAVREHLKTKGIDTSRIDVRAMGQNTARKPVDRVDVVFLRNGTPL